MNREEAAVQRFIDKIENSEADAKEVASQIYIFMKNHIAPWTNVRESAVIQKLLALTESSLLHDAERNYKDANSDWRASND